MSPTAFACVLFFVYSAPPLPSPPNTNTCRQLSQKVYRTPAFFSCASRQKRKTTTVCLLWYRRTNPRVENILLRHTISWCVLKEKEKEKKIAYETPLPKRGVFVLKWAGGQDCLHTLNIPKSQSTRFLPILFLSPAHGTRGCAIGSDGSLANPPHPRRTPCYSFPFRFVRLFRIARLRGVFRDDPPSPCLALPSPP